MKRCRFPDLAVIIFFIMVSFFLFSDPAFAQEKNASAEVAAQLTLAESQQAPEQAPSVPAEVAPAGAGKEVAAGEEEVKTPETITLDFKEADIRDVLKIISYKSGVNIVASPEVTGTVNVRITDVPWERALDVILKTYGYAYDKQDKIIMVAPLEKLMTQRKMEQDMAQVQPTVTEVVDLKYIDAVDAKKAIEPQLSPRGRITILEITGQAGWGFGGSFEQKRSRGSEVNSRSRTMIVSDIPPVLDRIRKMIEGIDVKPKQILIETRLVEISLNKLKDFGFDYATGGAGSSATSAVTTNSFTKELKAGGHSLGNLVSPAAFSPQASAITSANTGLNLVFQKLSGSKFEVLFHALEEKVGTNTLSAPSILTLDNQEATILVGEKFPIVNTTVSAQSATTVNVSLQEYKDIGIQLNVVPQVSGKAKDYINMIIHPAVTTEGTLIEAKYPRITTREVQTQVMIKSGETIIIGGLIKDVKNESVEGIPFLRKIPIFGKLFERTTVDTEKIELIIFITATIVDDNSLTNEQLSKLEQKLGLRSSSQK
ncbi:MAG: secretin and TonB N-terminal domain-containing protein [Candidatus Omnitrophota bacterium]